MDEYLIRLQLEPLKDLTRKYKINRHSKTKKAEILEIARIWFRNHPAETSEVLSGIISSTSPRTFSPGINANVNPIPTVTTYTTAVQVSPITSSSVEIEDDNFIIPIPSQQIENTCLTDSSIPEINQTLYLKYQSEQSELKQFKPPGSKVDLSKLLNPDRSEAFVDNTKYIQNTLDNKGGINFTSTAVIIRPKRFGKTTFGNLWLEFFRGNYELLQNTEIVKNLQIPPKNRYVCVELSFNSTTPRNINSYLGREFNLALSSIGIIQQIPEKNIESGIEEVLGTFAGILRINDKNGAIFIDEYDGIVRNSIANSIFTYAEALRVTKTFFTVLKDLWKFIPLVLVTGSSRISLKDVWSGANDSKDLSYDGLLANAFGYTWTDIERIYSVQLKMLEELYGNISRAVLKKHIQSMYGGYLFSPGATEEIFNTWAINRFIEYGKFSPYFTVSGLSNILTNGSFAKSTLEVLTNLDYKIDENLQTMTDWKFENTTKPQNELDTHMQLHGAGILTFVSGGIGDNIQLVIPNRDAIYAIQEILVPSAKNVSSQGFNILIRNFDLNGAIELARPSICKIALSTGMVYDTIDKVLEYHLQQGFFATLELLSNDLKGSACWKRRSEIKTVGKKRMDFVIGIPSANLGNIPHNIEFGRYKGTTNVSLIKELLAKLEQSRLYCEEYSRKINAPIMMASSSIWSYQAELLCGAGPYRWQDVPRISKQILDTPYESLKSGSYPNVKIYQKIKCDVKSDGTY